MSSAGTRYRLNGDEIVAETIAGEAVILNLSTGVYYSLDGAGGLVWSLLVRGHAPPEAAGRVASHFGVDESAALHDVEALVAELLEQSLLVEDAAAAPRELDEEELPTTVDYAKPRLQVFDEMDELLALDPPMPGLKEVPWRAPGG